MREHIPWHEYGHPYPGATRPRDYRLSNGVRVTGYRRPWWQREALGVAIGIGVSLFALLYVVIHLLIWLL